MLGIWQAHPGRPHSPLCLCVTVPGPCDPEDLIDGIIFAANYLGSTQLLSDKTPSKNVRMMQAQEAVSRIKVRDGVLCGVEGRAGVPGRPRWSPRLTYLVPSLEASALGRRCRQCLYMYQPTVLNRKEKDFQCVLAS